MERVKLECPYCGKGYRITSKKNNTSRCGICGHEGDSLEFIKHELKKESK